MANVTEVRDYTPRIIRVILTTEEWQAIASKLIQSFPNWQTHDFTMAQFEDAMESVLPQDRQRTFQDFEDVRHNLFKAFDVVAKDVKAGKIPALTISRKQTQVTRWTPEEWEKVVLELHRLKPTAFAEQLIKIGNKDAENAQKVLSHERHRHFVQVVSFRAVALKVWNELPADVRNPALQERAIVDFPSGPVMAPVAQKTDSQSPMKAAIQKAFKVPEDPEKLHRKHVTWSPSEWLQLAREMYRQNPHANYFSSNFYTVDLEAVRAAQREVLPLERRKPLAYTAGLRTPLVEAFKRLQSDLSLAVHAEIKAERLEIESVKVKVEDADFEEVIKRDIAPEAVAAPVAVALEAPKVPELAPRLESSEFMGGLLNAVAPLAQFLVTQVANQMAPAIIQALMPEMKKAMGTMFADAIRDAQNAASAAIPASPVHAYAAPTSAPTAAPIAQPAVSGASAEQVAAFKAAFPKQAEKPKKPIITILGPQGTRKELVEREFPQYDFIFIEHGHGVKEAGAKAELFICAIPFPPQGIKTAIRTHLNQDKVRFIDNCNISSIKRQIKVWEDLKK